MKKENNKQKRRLKIGLIISASLAIPAVACAIAVPLLLKTNNTNNNPNEGNVFVELDKQNQKAQNLLDANQDYTNRQDIDKAILYAHQLLTNNQSPIKTMVKQRNILAELELRTVLLNDNQPANAEAYLNLFHLADTRAQAQAVIATYNANEVPKFLKEINAVYQKEQAKMLNFESTMFNFERMYNRNEYGLSMNHMVNDLYQLTQLMIEKSKADYLTYDEITQFENLYNEVFDQASTKTSARTLKFSTINNIFKNVLREIADAQLSDSIKLALNNEINDLMSFVSNHQNFLDVEISNEDNQKVTGFDVIKNHLSSVLNNVANYFKNPIDIKVGIDSLVAELKTISGGLDEDLSQFVSTLLKKSYTTTNDVDVLFDNFNRLNRELNQIKVAQQLLGQINDKITTAFTNNVLDETTKNELLNEVTNLHFNDNFLTYISNLNNIGAKINAKTMFVKFNKKQKEQLLSELKYVQTNAVRMFLSEQEVLNLTNQVQNAGNDDELFTINQGINSVRTVYKKVLLNLLPRIKTELTEDFVLDSFKQTFSDLEENYTNYAQPYSLATRNQLITAVQWVLGFYDDLRVSRQKQRHSEFINLTIKPEVNTAFPEGKADKVKKNLLDKLNAILNQMNVVQDNTNLTYEQKQKKIYDLGVYADDLRAKITQIADLGLLAKQVDKELSLLEEDNESNKQIKAQLAARLKNINDLMSQAKTALDNPTEHNLKIVQDNLSDEFENFLKEKAEFNARSDFTRIKNLIEQTYASFREPNQAQTTLESKMLSKLTKLKNDIINPPSNLDEVAKEDYRNHLRAEMDVIASEVLLAAQYEKTVNNANKELDNAKTFLNKLNTTLVDPKNPTAGNLHDKLEALNPNPISLENDISNKQTELNTINAKINDLYNKQSSNQLNDLIPVINKDELAVLKQKADQVNQLIKLDLAKARLIAETYKVNDLSVHDAQESNPQPQPYKSLDDQLASLDASKNELLDLINNELTNPNLSSDEVAALTDRIDALQAKIVSQNALAKKLNIALKTYKELTSTWPIQYPEYAQQLSATIQANGLDFNNLNDSDLVRAQKIINLDNELNKQSNAQEAKDLLIKLINLRVNQAETISNNTSAIITETNGVLTDADHQNRAIYQTLDIELQDLINQYQTLIGNIDTTDDQFAGLIVNIRANLNDYRHKKNAAANNLKEAINKVTSLFALNKTLATNNGVDLTLTGLETPYLIALENWFKTVTSSAIIPNQTDVYSSEYLNHFKIVSALLSNSSEKGFFNLYEISKNHDSVSFRPVSNVYDANINVEYINQFVNLINLAYNKDIFVKNKKALEAKVNVLAGHEDNNLDSNSTIKLTDPKPSATDTALIAQLNDLVLNTIDPTDLASISNALNKLEQLNALVDKQTQVALKINNINNNDQRETLNLTTDELVKALNENKPTADAEGNYAYIAKPNDGTNSAPAEINRYLNAMNDALNNNSSLTQTKAAIEEDISKLETRFNELYDENIHDNDIQESLWSEQTLGGKIKGLLQKYRQEVKNLDNTDLNAAKQKASEIQNNISTINTNLNNLLELAKVVKETETKKNEAPTAVDSDVTDDSLALINQIKQEMNEKVTSAKQKYADLDSYDQISLTTDELNNLMSDLQEAEVMREHYLQASKLLKTFTYHQMIASVSDTEQNTTSRAKAQAYLNYFNTKVNDVTNPQNRVHALELRRVNFLLEKVVSLYTKQKNRYEKENAIADQEYMWKTVVDDTTFSVENTNNYWWFNQDQGNDFNPFSFTNDAFLLSKVIIDTIPNTPDSSEIDEAFFNQQVNQLNESLINGLGIKFDNTYNTYLQRKNLIDLVLTKTGNDGYYENDHERLTNNTDQFLTAHPEAYNNLKTAMNNFYYHGDTAILNNLKQPKTSSDNFVANQNAIASTKSHIIKVRSLIESYVMLAQAVQKDLDIISKYVTNNNGTYTINPGTNEKISATVQLLLDLNKEVIDSYYYKNDNLAQIKTQEQKILRLTARMKILEAYTERLVQLNNAASANNSWVTDENKAPLLNILEHAVALSTASNDTSAFTYEQYYNQFIDGDQTSFDNSFKNTEQLAKLVVLAETFQLNQTPNTPRYTEHSAAMNTLYAELDNLIIRAKKVLKTPATGDNVAWLNAQKTNQGIIQTLIFEIGDESRGIITRLKNQKQLEISTFKQQAQTLYTYITNNYQSNASPLLTTSNMGGSNNDVTFIWNDNSNPFNSEATINNFDDLKTWTENINTWTVKLQAQVDQLIKYERNKLRAIRNKTQVYLSFLNTTAITTNINDPDLTTRNNNANIDHNLLLKAVGLDNQLISNAVNLLNNTNTNLADDFVLVPVSDNESKYTKLFDPLSEYYYQNIIGAKYSNLTADLTNIFDSILTISINSLNKLKIDAYAFGNDLKTPTGDNINLRSYLDEVIKVLKHIEDGASTGYPEILTTRLNDLITKTDALNTSVNLADPVSETINYNLEHLDDAIKTARNNAWTGFENFATKAVDALSAINKLIYGTDQLDTSAYTDEYSLRKVINDFLDQRTNFNTMLNLVAKENLTTIDSVFSNVKSSYINNTNNVNTLKSNVLNQYKDSDLALTNLLTSTKDLYKAAVDLNKWMLDSSNQSFFFDYLNQPHNDNQKETNATNIRPKQVVLAEQFVQQVHEWEQDTSRLQTVGNKKYLWINKELSDITKLADLFDDFSVLSNEQDQIFSNNVRIYLVKETQDPDFTKSYLQTNTAYKKVKINLAFEYVKPTENMQNNIFWNVNSFKTSVDDIFIRFHTLNEVVIDKTYLAPETNNVSSNINLFNSAKAGWNNKNLIYNFVNSVASQSAIYAQHHNLEYLKDNAFKNSDAGANKNSGMKIKFKTNNNGIRIPYNGSDHYFVNATDNTTNNSYVYWNAATFDLKGNDQKFSFWIPVFIAIPVQDKNDPSIKGALYISFQIISNDINWTNGNGINIKPDLYISLWAAWDYGSQHVGFVPVGYENSNTNTADEIAQWLIKNKSDKSLSDGFTRSLSNQNIERQGNQFKDGIEYFDISITLHPKQDDDESNN
ncbi:hypothetical protein OF377_02860 [Ureaplasma sp. ES3154-GEN]|uniref:hypothetical protein n=1 Tax=Ureaplasma sp. ES3154-GEN TaxID=2984844 RepID=UPI0021E72054|nr:hypothetical protein [Ureaplasma sp. ES3154-GEN]MCV3743802.1 hypothetical protein [Ureaplasma sp. ES3154-GEN]